MAQITTDADLLKECLNDMRIVDFSRETDEKISIVERALANCNDGRGVGFCVNNVVIDKKMLGQIALKLYGFLGSSIPIVLAYSAFAEDSCEALTPEQAALLVMKLSAASTGGGAHCSMANITIAQVLGM